MTNYQAPTAEMVAEALRRIPTITLRRAFYGKPLNPLWVRPLLEAGAFTSPSEPQVTDDGYIRDVYWPEIDYLIRASDDVPADVVDVCLLCRRPAMLGSNGRCLRSVPRSPPLKVHA